MGKLKNSRRNLSYVNDGLIRSLSSENLLGITSTIPTQVTSRDDMSRQQSIKVLWISLDQYSQISQFFILASGIFVFYLLYGYFQEVIFQLPGMKPFGWYLTLVQFKLYSSFAFFESRLRGDKVRRIPLKIYCLLAVLTVATMGFSNSSVAYLNYPTQVMFKCCKLIPVLFCTYFIQGKKIGAINFLAAICMSLGLVFFTLGDAQVSPTYDTSGIVMITLALIADAAIGNVQEKHMKKCNATNTEVVLYSYLIGFIYILAFMITTNQLGEAHHFCIQHPLETYGYFFIFSVTGYFGIQLVLTLIQTSGVFIAVTVTTCRKAVTIILSFVFFAKPFTFQYVWSGLLVLLGIYLNAYNKMDSKGTETFQLANLLKKIMHKCPWSKRANPFTSTSVNV